MFHIRIIFFLKLFFFTCLNCLSQHYFPVQLFKFTHSEINNVTSIVKDNKNFIWFSSQGGISRFDSKTFVNIPVSSNGQTVENWTAVKKLFYDSTNDKLFAISSTKGLAILNIMASLSYFQPLQLPNNLRNLEITDIAFFNGLYLIFSSQGSYTLKLIYNDQEKKFELIILRNFVSIQAILFTKYDANSFIIYTPQGQLVKYKITENNEIIKSHVITSFLNLKEIAGNISIHQAFI